MTPNPLSHTSEGLRQHFRFHELGCLKLSSDLGSSHCLNKLSNPFFGDFPNAFIISLSLFFLLSLDNFNHSFYSLILPSACSRLIFMFSIEFFSLFIVFLTLKLFDFFLFVELLIFSYSISMMSLSYSFVFSCSSVSIYRTITFISLSPFLWGQLVEIYYNPLM